MNDTTLGPLERGSARYRYLSSLARHNVLRRLEGLDAGTLVIEEDGKRLRFGAGEPVIRLEVLDPRLWADVAFGGAVGAGEAYMAGAWRSDDLVGLVRLLVRNRPILGRMDTGLARFSGRLRQVIHRLNRNTRSGSRRNVAAHYDLGNDFYRLWLDETLMYSCALFEHPDMTLAEASQAKIRHICRKLDLKPGDEVLEIGTGWGGFAVHAAREHGCRVTTTTISREQYDLARRRVAEAGLAERVKVLLEDYRDLAGRYDKLVSIEMVEAVGADYLQTFFRLCGSILKPGGAMLLQAITVPDQRYEAARSNVDFIKRYIFPGGFLPSVTALTGAATAASNLRAVHLEDIGLHYAETLRRWRANFLGALDQVRGLGFDDVFIRMWEYYLCYCEGGFRERDISTVQMVFAKPR